MGPASAPHTGKDTSCFGDRLGKLFIRRIQQHPVSRNGSGHIIGLPQSALYFQRSNADPPQFGNQFNSAEILGGKEKSVAFVGKITAAAGLFALAPVTAVSPQVGGKITCS